MLYISEREVIQYIINSIKYMAYVAMQFKIELTGYFNIIFKSYIINEVTFVNSIV